MGSVAVIVVAAGSGSRLGARVPKALVPLAGEALLSRALGNVVRCADVSHVVVVAPRSHLDEATAQAAASRARRVGGPPGIPVVVVAGGATRGASVAAGLAALPEGVDIVLVHDAARALAPPSLFSAVIGAVRDGHPAVVPGMPVTDTIKEVDSAGGVVRTPARVALRAVQTPQGFLREVLVRAHAPGAAATDDAALVEALGVRVQVVAGDPLAFKVTSPDDLAVAERLLRSGQAG